MPSQYSLFHFTGTWTKNCFDNTMTQFRNMITKWFLGTGGGDGRSTLFENWDAVKLEKYDIDPDEYDHTNMASRPSILINKYHTHKTPYLTMIYLWDEKVDFLLSSKYDPLDAGTGEAGINDEESISGHTSSSSSFRKRSPKPKIKIKKTKQSESHKSINDSMMAIVNLLNTNKKEEKKAAVVSEAKMSLQDLNALYDKHVSHLKFMKENDLLTDEKKNNIVCNIEDVYEMITKSHSTKKRSRADDVEVVDNNSSSKVS